MLKLLQLHLEHTCQGAARAGDTCRRVGGSRAVEAGGGVADRDSDTGKGGALFVGHGAGQRRSPGLSEDRRRRQKACNHEPDENADRNGEEPHAYSPLGACKKRTKARCGRGIDGCFPGSNGRMLGSVIRRQG